MADASKGIAPDIDGCTLFQYGPIPVVHVNTSSWQPNPAAVGQTISSTVTTQVDNPYQAPSGHSISQRWAWTTGGVSQSPDGSSGSFTPCTGYAIGWTQGSPATTFSGIFNNGGYYIIKVTATLTYHDDTAGADVGTYSGVGYIGGDATDLAPPPAAASSRATAKAQPNAGTASKGVPVINPNLSVTFKEVVQSSGLEINLPNSTDTPTYGHNVTIPVPGLIVPFDPSPNPYHGNINNVFVDINPQPSPNQIKFQPVSSGTGVVSVSPSTLTYSASEYALLATGVKVGETGGVDVVPTAAGASPLAHLRVAVLPHETVTVAFHLLSDTADATHAAHSTIRTAADVDAMLTTMNSIWNKQANVFFVNGSVDSLQYPTYISGPVDPNVINNWQQNGRVPYELNVYLVWDTTNGETSASGVKKSVSGITLWNVTSSDLGLVLIGEIEFSDKPTAKLAPSEEGKVLAHEAGHAMHIFGDYYYDPDYLMTADQSALQGSKNPDGFYSITIPTRIHYEEAKTANSLVVSSVQNNTGQK